MNEEDAKLAALDARLRGLFGGLDARKGFEARVQARIASLTVTDPATRADLKSQFEHRCEREHRRLAREAWMNGLTIAGLGLTGVALVWRFAPILRQWAVTTVQGVELDSVQSTLLSVALLAALLWPVLRRYGAGS